METNDFKYPSIRQVQETYRNANEEQRSLLVELFGQAAKKRTSGNGTDKDVRGRMQGVGRESPVCGSVQRDFQ